MYCYYCGAQRRPTVPFTEEHVLPLSIGGPRAWLLSICKPCNSAMGKHADGPLVNHFLVSFDRTRRALRGQSGRSPFVEMKGTVSEGGVSRAASCRIHADGRGELMLAPHVSSVADEQGVRVQVRAGSRERAASILEKWNARGGKRRGRVDLEVAMASLEEIEFQPELESSFSTRTADFLPAFTKMALGFGCLWFGRTFSRTPNARSYRRYLHACASGTQLSPAFWAQCFPMQSNREFVELSRYSDWHLVSLHRRPVEGVFLHVLLFGTFDAMFRLGADFSVAALPQLGIGSSVHFLTEPGKNVVHHFASTVDYDAFRRRNPAPEPPGLPELSEFRVVR